MIRIDASGLLSLSLGAAVCATIIGWVSPPEGDQGRRLDESPCGVQDQVRIPTTRLTAHTVQWTQSAVR